MDELSNKKSVWKMFQCSYVVTTKRTKYTFGENGTFWQGSCEKTNHHDDKANKMKKIRSVCKHFQKKFPANFFAPNSPVIP